jgi:hypothetical protein
MKPTGAVRLPSTAGCCRSLPMAILAGVSRSRLARFEEGARRTLRTRPQAVAQNERLRAGGESGSTSLMTL